MIAVFVNCAAIILGSLVGLVCTSRINHDLSDVVQTAAGIVTIVIGVEMALEYQSIVILALSLISGGILGFFLDVDGKILRFGAFLEKKFSAKKHTDVKHDFARAFLNASVLFCVGAMSILGSLKAGIDKDYTIIFTKSILDGFMAIVFTAAMGAGTAFAAVTVLVYQGALTLLAGVAAPYADAGLIKEISAAGGALIIMIGVNLLGLKQIKTANYLPAVVISVLLVLVSRFFF